MYRLNQEGECISECNVLLHVPVIHYTFCAAQTVTSITLREDEELQRFFKTLVSTYLNSQSQYARIDILNCPG